MGVIIQGNSRGISSNKNDPQVWGHAATMAMPISMASTVTWGNGDITDGGLC